MRVAIVTHSSTFESRAEAVARFFEDRGDTVTRIFSDFDHHAKATVSRSLPDHVFLHLRPFRRNLSVRRMTSIRRFAKDAGAWIDARMRGSEPFDLLWFLLPANSFAPVADDLHRRYDVPVVFDIIDLWPESLPVRGLSWTPPVRMWRSLRDRHLGCACQIFTECDRYREVLDLPEDRTTTLYWYKSTDGIDPQPVPAIDLGSAGSGANEPGDVASDVAPPTGLRADAAWRDMSDGTPLRIAYLGAVNNIIDIPLIADLLGAMARRHPLELHVIGAGEHLDDFVAAVRSRSVPVISHGAIYDERTKNAILGDCAYGINIMKPTVTVGLSMKSIDYLYCGLPLLNTIGGDTWNLVESQGIGVNVDRDDVPDAADFAIAEALNPVSAPSMHESAYACYRELFTQERFRAVLADAMERHIGIPARAQA